MAKRQTAAQRKAAQAKASKGDDQPVAVPAQTQPEPSNEERAQERVTRGIRALVPQLDEQITEIFRRLTELEAQIKAVGNSINTQPATVEKAADPYFSKGPKGPK
jgi:hypothetical protein